jgi:hypothetical protein
VAVTAAAVALAGTASATATAAPARDREQEPTYRCVLLETGRDLAVGRHCQASHGAPHDGPVFGSFRIESPRGDVHCEFIRPFSGFVHLPEEVDGRCCERVVR